MSLVYAQRQLSQWAESTGEEATNVVVVAGSVSFGFRLVSDENIDKRQELVDLGLEELRNERSRQVHREGLRSATSVRELSFQGCRARETDLFVVESVLSEVLGGFESVSEEETTEVVDLGSVNQSLDGGSLEVCRFEVLSSSESSAEGSAIV